MKPLLLFLLLAVASCSKDNDHICWVCDMTNIPPGSTNIPDEVEICNDSDQAPTQYTDGMGNTVGGFECVRKR